MDEYSSDKDISKDSDNPELSSSEIVNEDNDNLFDGEDSETQKTDTQEVMNDEDFEGNNCKHPEMELNSESDRMDELRQMLKYSQPPNDIIMECLAESFSNFDEVYQFCYTHFERFSKELGTNNGFRSAIVRLIKYCKTHGEIERLWSYIKSKRKNHYKTFYPKWKKAIENIRRNKNNSEHSKAFDPIDQYRSDSVIRENLNDSINEPHPLFGNDFNEINHWFFDELNKSDQSRVLTVALFEGISRKHIEQIAQEIQHRIFEIQ